MTRRCGRCRLPLSRRRYRADVGNHCACHILRPVEAPRERPAPDAAQMRELSQLGVLARAAAAKMANAPLYERALRARGSWRPS